MSPHRAAADFLQSVSNPIVLAFTLGSAMVSWLANLVGTAMDGGHVVVALADPAALATSAAAGILAVTGAGILAYKQIAGARIEVRRQQEEAYKGSLQEQLDKQSALLAESVADGKRQRESLHALRNEASAEAMRLKADLIEREERHASEVDRLMGQIADLIAQNRAFADQFKLQFDENDRLRRQIRSEHERTRAVGGEANNKLDRIERRIATTPDPDS